MRKTGFRKFNQYITTWCMLSIASSHCILTISCDFYPKIWRRLEWKISAATWNWNDLTWLGAAKSTQSIDLTAATLRSMSITFLSDFGYLESFRRYSRSKSKVVKNREKLDVFLPSQILGGRPSKSYTNVMTPALSQVVWKMFCGDTPTSPEVIVANTLNFKPNFKFSRLKFFSGDPRPTSGVRYQGLVSL